MAGLSHLIEIMTSIQKHIDVAVYTQKYYEAKLIDIELNRLKDRTKAREQYERKLQKIDEAFDSAYDAVQAEMTSSLKASNSHARASIEQALSKLPPVKPQRKKGTSPLARAGLSITLGS